MDHATCTRLLRATHFATSLRPLTARLIPLITELGRLIVTSRRADVTPQAGHRFENRLQELLRELGRVILGEAKRQGEKGSGADLDAPGPGRKGVRSRS